MLDRRRATIAAMLVLFSAASAREVAASVVCIKDDGSIIVRKKCKSLEERADADSLRGPKGDTGDQGAKGDPGAQGTTGPSAGLGLVVDANIHGESPVLGRDVVESLSAGVIEGPNLTLLQNPGSIATQLPCAGVNPPTGFNCFAGDGSVGVAFVPPRAGAYRACVTFTHHENLLNAALVANGLTIFEIVETQVATQNIVQNGKSQALSGVANDANEAWWTHNLCGTFTFATADRRVLRLRYRQPIAPTLADPADSNVVLVDSGPDLLGVTVHWEVYYAGS